MCCGSCIAKYTLCLLNFIIFVIGAIALGIGIWLTQKQSFNSLLLVIPKEHITGFTAPAVIHQASYLLIAAGALMFTISFLGCCGALREGPCLLTTYGAFLTVILILELTAGGLVLAYQDKAEIQTKFLLKTSISRYYASENKTDAVTLAWNYLQLKLKCCGVDDFADFANTGWKTETEKVIPESCCVSEDTGLMRPLSPTCTIAPNEANSYFKKGCYKAVMRWIMLNINIIIYVGMSLGVIQLICTILAFCLIKSREGEMYPPRMFAQRI